MTKKKKIILLSVASAVLVIALVCTAVVLTNATGRAKTFSGTVVDVTAKKKLIADDIIDWVSEDKTHTYVSINSNAKCGITVDGVPYDDYSSFEEGWIAACTTYKNKGALEFVLYADWIADENGSFGSDTTLSYFGSTGGVLINNWTSDITINLNGYKIDRNLTSASVNSGEVLCINDSNKVYIKNGYITGGAGTGDGGGVWINGDDVEATFENMIISGNLTGANGGGIYVSDSVDDLDLNNTTVQGNYAEGYGGGVYCDCSVSLFSNSVLSLYNSIKIQNNRGCDGRNNLTLYTCENVGNTAKLWDVELASDSCVYISLSAKKDSYRSIIDSIYYDHNNNQYLHSEFSEYEIRSQFEPSSTGGYYILVFAKKDTGC